MWANTDNCFSTHFETLYFDSNDRRNSIITRLVAFVTPTDRPKSVRNRCVIEVFGGVFVLLRCFLDFSVGVGAFVIGLSQISSFFSYVKDKIIKVSFCPLWNLEDCCFCPLTFWFHILIIIVSGDMRTIFIRYLGPRKRSSSVLKLQNAESWVLKILDTRMVLDLINLANLYSWWSLENATCQHQRVLFLKRLIHFYLTWYYFQ